MRQLEYKDNQMRGKKLNIRESPDDEKRKQTLENSLFYYEYLNNTLNYILSGSNDLDHYLNYDQQVLKNIISTEPRDESIYFVERAKMMKTRCDPNLYLKDLQQYGQFTNYEISRTTMQDIRNIEKELEDEKEINFLIKRLKRRNKIEGDLTVFEARRMDKQLKQDLVNSICQQWKGIKVEKKGNFEDSKLYRQMFNITQNSLKDEIPDQNRAAKLARSKLIRKPIKTAKEEYSPYVPKLKESAKQQLSTINRKVAEPIAEKISNEPSQLQPIKAINYTGTSVINFISPHILPETNFIQSVIKQQQKDKPILPSQNQKNLQPTINTQYQKKQNSIIPEKPTQKQLTKIPITPAVPNQQYHLPFFDGNSQTQAHEKKVHKQKKISKAGQAKKKKQINYREYSDDELNIKKEKNEKKRSYNKRPNAKHQIHPFPQIHQYPYRSPLIHMDQPITGYPPQAPPVKQSAQIGIQVDPNEDIQPLKVLTPRRPFTFSIITNPTNSNNPTNSAPSYPPNTNSIVPIPPRAIENQQNPISNSLVAQNEGEAFQMINPLMNAESLQQNNQILTDSQRFFNQSRDFSVSRPRADSLLSEGKNNSQMNGSKKDDIDIFFSFLDK